jgi:hypothetical protein
MNPTTELSEFDQHLAALVAQEVQKNQTAATPPPAGAPLKLNVSGREYQFSDPKEIEGAIAKTVETYEAELAKYREQLASIPAPAPANRVTGDEDATPRFSNDEFLKMLETDSAGAFEKMLSEKIFGGKVDNPSEILREAVLGIAEQRKTSAVGSFLQSHQDIAANIEHQKAIEQARLHLNLPVTPEGLNAAYGFAISQGAVPPPQFQQNPQYGAPQPQYPQRNAPPAAPRGGAQTGTGPTSQEDWARLAGGLSTEQLADILRQNGRL